MEDEGDRLLRRRRLRHASNLAFRRIQRPVAGTADCAARRIRGWLAARPSPDRCGLRRSRSAARIRPPALLSPSSACPPPGSARPRRTPSVAHPPRSASLGQRRTPSRRAGPPQAAPRIGRFRFRRVARTNGDWQSGNRTRRQRRSAARLRRNAAWTAATWAPPRRPAPPPRQVRRPGQCPSAVPAGCGRRDPPHWPRR